MINKQNLYFALRLQSLIDLKLTVITSDSIQGCCSLKVIGKLATYCVQRGYFMEFSSSPSNKLTADFTIDLLS